MLRWNNRLPRNFRNADRSELVRVADEQLEAGQAGEQKKAAAPMSADRLFEKMELKVAGV